MSADKKPSPVAADATTPAEESGDAADFAAFAEEAAFPKDIAALCAATERGATRALSLLAHQPEPHPLVTEDNAPLLAQAFARLAGSCGGCARRVLRAADAAVSALVRSAAFANALSHELTRLAGADLRAVACAAHFATAAAVAASAGACDDTVQRRLFVCIARLHAGIAGIARPSLADRRVVNSVRATLRRALEGNAQLAARYAALLDEAGSSVDARRALCPVAGTVWSAETMLYADTPRCLRVCEALLLDAGTAGDVEPPKAHVDAWGAVLAILSPGELAEHVLPTVSRLVRRSALPGLRMLVDVLRHAANTDTHVVNELLLKLLSPEIRAQEADRQSLAIDALRRALSLLPKADAAAAERFVEHTLRILNGTDGPLQYAAQRTGVLRALGTVLEVGIAVPPRVAETAAQQIVAFERKETNDDVKGACIRAAGAWLCAAGGVLPKEALEMLTSSRHLEKEATCNAIASSIADIAPFVVKSGASPKLAAAMLKVAQQQAAKAPKVAFAGLPEALRAVLAIMAAAGDSGDAKLWVDGPLGPSSVVYTPAFFARLGEEGQVSALKFASEVFTHHHAKALALPEGHCWLLFNLLLSVLSSPLSSVRIAARKECRKLFELVPSLPSLLVRAAAHRVHLLAEGIQAKKGPHGHIFPPAGLHSDALRAIACPLLAPETVPLLFVLTQHPLVSPAVVSSKRELWHSVAHKMCPGTNAKAAASQTLDKNSAQIAELVCSANVLGAKERTSIEAGVASAVTAATLCSSDGPMLGMLLPKLLASGSKAAADVLASMSEHELAVLLAPPGSLVPVAPEEDQEKAHSSKGAASVQRERKQRGESRMYSVAEERWDIEMRKQLERKKEAERATEHTEHVKKLIAEQDQLREMLALRTLPIAKFFEALGNACLANQRAAVLNMPQLFPGAVALLGKGPVVLPAAAELVQSLARCVPQPIPKVFFVPIATATVEIYSRDPEGFSVPPEMVSVLTRVLFDVSDLRQLPLSAAAFSMVFPLIKATMLQPLSAELQRAHLAGIKLLGAHTQPGPAFPRGQMATTLVHVMENFPRFIVRSRSYMLELAEGMTREDVLMFIHGVLSANASVREACLSSLKKVPALQQLVGSEQTAAAASVDNRLALYLAMARFDPVAENSEVAKELFASCGCVVPADTFDKLRKFVLEGDTAVQNMAAAAVSAAAQAHPNTVNALLSAILQAYKSNAVPINPKTGEVDGVFMPEELQARRRARVGLLSCLGACGPAFNTFDQLQRVFKHLLTQSLSDEEELRALAVASGSRILEAQGQHHTAQLFAFFDEQVAKSSKANQLIRDHVKEAIVLFMAILVRYGGQDRLSKVLSQLELLLSTPSETVQQAVASCYTAIAQMLPPEVQEETVKSLLGRTVRAGPASQRRGSAYALAGLLKGLGLASVKRFDVMNVLTAAVGKKKPEARQGALFAFELLSMRLGRLFEPYVIQILPKLLVCFGDSSAEVREATSFTARAIMGQLSAHGAKLVLPALVKATADPSWRTKANSVELLGSMAFLSPQQLSSCLPDVVPSILVVIQDSHPEVHAAARQALQCIGSVIHNPEIRTVVSAILEAIDDPANTKAALEALERIDFEHAIDPASLSLVMPVVQRGLREHSLDTRKRAAQIVGNMCSLTETRDLVPYIVSVVNDLKVILTDPSPEVRAITAKALGSLTHGIGEEHFRDLVPWLLETMRSDKGPVERSGAAQGLSEVLGGMAPERVRTVMPGLLDLVFDASPLVREGALALFRFLPGTVGPEFERHLERALEGVMEGAADTIETVREAAMRAGMAIVNAFSATSMPRIAVVLQSAVLDNNWRVQDASLNFLNDVFQRALATDPPLASRDPSRLLFRVLGEVPMRVMLAAVFTARFDTNSGVVAQRAIVLWKTSVTNPPRMLTAILPQFMDLLVKALSSSSQQLQVTASRALGDLVERLNTRILPEVIPFLERALEKDDENVRQGACMGFSEVVRASGKQNLGTYSDVVLPAVRKALGDPSPRVRSVAGGLLATLTDTIGPRVLESVISRTTELLKSALASGASAEDGAKAVENAIAVAEAQPYPALRAIVPLLATPPVSEFAATALVDLLTAVSTGSAAAVMHHLRTIVFALLETDSDYAFDALQKLAVGFNRILAAKYISVLTSVFEEEEEEEDEEEDKDEDEDDEEEKEEEEEEKVSVDEKIKLAALRALTAFIGTSPIPLEEEPEMATALGVFVKLLGESSRPLHEAAGAAIDKFVTSTKKELFPRFLPIVRDALIEATEIAGTDALPGLCRPRGLAPLLPLFLTSLMNVATAAEASAASSDAAAAASLLDPNQTREEAASGLGDLVRLTDTASLAPFVVAIAGPLIRIVGDRFPAGVKSAILRTLTLLLERGEAKLRQFVPQLQSTFVKSVRDPSFVVRSLATVALGKLVVLGSRIDSLLSEILTGIGASGDAADIVGTLLATLAAVLQNTTAVPDQKVAARIGPAIASLLGHAEQPVRTAAADAYAHSLRFLPEDLVATLFATDPLFDRGTFLRWQQRDARSHLIGVIAQSWPKIFVRHGEKLCAVLHDDIFCNDTGAVRVSAVWACSRAFGNQDAAEAAISGRLPADAIAAISDPAYDVAIAAVEACGHFAKCCPALAKPFAAEMHASSSSRFRVATTSLKAAITAALPAFQALI